MTLLRESMWYAEEAFSSTTAAHHPSEQVCATCISSVSRLLQLFDFPVVFFDEASMATETASIIPLTKGVSIHLLYGSSDRQLSARTTATIQCSHLAIIGDHKQLPPVVISPEAKVGGFARSLFERLIQYKPSSGT